MRLDAHLNENAPAKYRGLERFAARKQVLADLRAQGLLASEKPYRLRVPRSGRTGEIVEPLLTDQWFVATEKLARPALAAALSADLKFFPEHWTTTYRQWLENIQDWCISRQLWWGHQIPAWYDEAGDLYVARDEDEAVAKWQQELDSETAVAESRNDQSTLHRLSLKRAAGPQLKRDEDVLDTWYSSALVPF